MKMNTNLIEKILSSLLHTTDTQLRKVQFAKCPHFADYLDITYTNNDTYYHDEDKLRSVNRVFKINNIETIKKVSRIHTYSGPILDLFNRGILKPFIIFINGEFIDLERIKFITDTRNTYLEVSGFGNIDYKIGSDTTFTTLNGYYRFILPKVYENYKDLMNLFIGYKDLSTIGYIRLNKQLISPGKVNPNYINTDSANILEIYCENCEVSTIQFKNTDIAPIDINTIEAIVLPEGFIYETTKTPNIYSNPLLFKSGAFIPIYEYTSIPLEYEVKSLVINNTKNKEFTEYLFGSKFLGFQINPKYKVFKDSILAFSNGYPVREFIDYGNNLFEFNSDIDAICKLYYYEENESNDNIKKLSNMSNLIQRIINNNIPENLDIITNPFDFVMDKVLSKEERIKNLVEHICNYNSFLLQDYIDYHSNIEVIQYSSSQIREKSKYENGEYILTRLLKPDHKLDSGIIVFKNGLLYDYNNVEYDNNYIKIKFNEKELLDEDNFDIMIFKDVFNDNISIKITPKNNEYLVSNYIPFKDIILLTDDIDNHIYKHIPKSENLQYEIDSELNDIGNGYITINVSEYYNDKYVHLSSRRKFIHDQYIIDGTEELINELYTIVLPETFKYCTNSGQFIVFYNGRKVNNSDVFVCLNKWNLPFEKRFLHITKKCQIGDKLDIFYVPEEMAEVYVSDFISENGYIDIEKSKLGYNLDGKNCSIFINGRRISTNDILSVSEDMVRLIHDYTSLKNISVLQHISYRDDIFNTIGSIDSIWNQMIQTFTEDELDELFGLDIILTDTEEDMKLNSYTKVMVLYDIIRRYWLTNKNKVRVENPVFYIREYGDDLVLTIDSNMDMIDILEVLDENVFDDTMVVEYGGQQSVPLDASQFFIPYDSINKNEYIPYYNNAVATIEMDADLESKLEGYNIIDLIIENADDSMVVNYGGEDSIPIDAIKEYLVNANSLEDIVEFNSIDAAIIMPYFYLDFLCIGEGLIRPIFIDAKLEQIESLPPLF